MQEALNRDGSDWDALSLATQVAWARDDSAEALRFLGKLHAQDPAHEAIARSLVEHLVEAGEPDEALEVLDRAGPAGLAWVHVARGEALYAMDRLAEAEDQFARAVGMLQSRLDDPIVPAQWETVKQEHAEASRLLNDVVARQRGAEEVIGVAARGGALDGRAGVNYKLLGMRAMLDAPPLTEKVVLVTPEEDEALGRAAVEERADDLQGLCRLGIGLLRLSRHAEASSTFRRALNVQPDHWPALFGLGAVLDREAHGVLARIDRMPTSYEPPQLRTVVPDFPSLTEREQRIVLCSVDPLRAALPRLARMGVRMRILPLSVRATDLPEFEDVAGVRADDHRSYDACTGMSDGTNAFCKIEDLLDLDGDSGWVFGHEFSHLVLSRFADELLPFVLPLWERAQAEEEAHVLEDYQLENEQEFFAVAFTDHLARRHGFRLRKEQADLGLLAEINELFLDLAEHDDFELAAWG